MQFKKLTDWPTDWKTIILSYGKRWYISFIKHDSQQRTQVKQSVGQSVSYFKFNLTTKTVPYPFKLENIILDERVIEYIK